MAEPSPFLDLVLAKVDQARKDSLVQRDREVANAMAAEAIISKAVLDTQKIGQAKAVEITAAQTGQMVAQQQTQEAVNQAGGFDALYSLIAQTSKAVQRTQQELQAVREEELSTTGFSPIGALKLALDWSGNQTRLKNSIQEVQVLQAGAERITSQITQVGNLAKASAKTITDASIQASADQVKLQAEVQAAEIALKGLQANTAGVIAMAAASDRDLQYATAAGQFARQEAQFQLALEEEARRRAQFSWEQEKARALKEERLEEKGFEERTIAYINLGEISRGLTPSTPQMIRDMIKLNKGLSQEYVDLYKNGEIASRTGQAIIAESPGKVAAIFSRDPSLISSLDANQKKVAELVMEASKVLGDKSVRSKEGLDDDKTGAKANRVVTQAVQTAISRQLAYVGNNPDNVFYIGDPSAFIGTKDQPGVSAFQKYTLTKKVFEPAIASNVSLTDVSVPFKLSLEAVKRGELSSVQAAADFSNIYKRMSALHRAGSDFRKFAISLPPDGASYRVKIDGEIIDVTDFVSVAQAMTRSLAKQAFDAKPLPEKIFPPSGAFERLSQGTRK